MHTRTTLLYCVTIIVITHSHSSARVL